MTEPAEVRKIQVENGGRTISVEHLSHGTWRLSTKDGGFAEGPHLDIVLGHLLGRRSSAMLPLTIQILRSFESRET